jgi:nucleotide-binding universal stress UspA family protein
LADIRREEDRTMSNFSKRAVRWAAPVALVGAVGLVACGDGDETTRTAAPKAAVSGSENRPAYVRWTSRFGVHLEIPAEEIAQLVAHRERADRAAAARLAAQADQYERLAHLEGQAKTYGGIEAGHLAWAWDQIAQAE